MNAYTARASTAGVMTNRTLFPFLETSLVNSGFPRSYKTEDTLASEEAAESSAQR